MNPRPEKVDQVLFRCSPTPHAFDSLDGYALAVVVHTGVNGSVREQIGHHERTVSEPQVEVNTVFIINGDFRPNGVVKGNLYDAGCHLDDRIARLHAVHAGGKFLNDRVQCSFRLTSRLDYG